MKVLIDTHIALWAISDDLKLPQAARDILLDTANEIYYSTASVWELTIKHMLHPQQIMLDGRGFADACEATGFKCLPILNRHTFEIEILTRDSHAPLHNDPFDRLLIAQAKSEGFDFLTCDSLLPYYNEPCVVFVG